MRESAVFRCFGSAGDVRGIHSSVYRLSAQHVKLHLGVQKEACSAVGDMTANLKSAIYGTTARQYNMNRSLRESVRCLLAL